MTTEQFLQRYGGSERAAQDAERKREWTPKPNLLHMTAEQRVQEHAEASERARARGHRYAYQSRTDPSQPRTGTIRAERRAAAGMHLEQSSAEAALYAEETERYVYQRTGRENLALLQRAYLDREPQPARCLGEPWTACYPV